MSSVHTSDLSSFEESPVSDTEPASEGEGAMSLSGEEQGDGEKDGKAQGWC